jgi:LmbE family N-acetylglucosaminyl deacetylase
LRAEDAERLSRALNQQLIQHNQEIKMSAESNTAVGIAITAQAWEAIAGAYDLQTHVAPDVILDITPVFETKVAAMRCMDAQVHLWNYYTDVAKRRGTQGGRNSGNPAIVYAEAFQRVHPRVTQEALS